MRVGVVQLQGCDDPQRNLSVTSDLIKGAASAGANLIATPEVSNLIGASKSQQSSLLRSETDDPSLKAYQSLASDLSIWLSLGSLSLLCDNGQLANRSFMIAPDGSIRARYDKIHMFDVQLSDTESYSESDQYRAGNSAVTAQTELGIIGLTICYDIRFPQLYRDLAQAGATILMVPCAFTKSTGAAHLETLLRARAIETGCFVIAACQTGTHGKRETYGHSMVVDPWGTVLLDAGIEPGFFIVDCDPNAVTLARGKIPSLRHDREYKKPKHA